MDLYWICLEDLSRFKVSKWVIISVKSSEGLISPATGDRTLLTVNRLPYV